MVATALCVAASMTVMLAPFSLPTNAVLPSGVNAIPRGRGPVFTRPATLLAAVSTATTSLVASQPT